MRILFAGVRWESCQALCIVCKNYGIPVDVITFKDTFIEKRLKSFREPSRKYIFKTEKKYSLEQLNKILNYDKYDVFYSVGFPYILPSKMLKANTIFINSHPHLLPEHKGSRPIRDSFRNKANRYGVTIHRISSKVDSGKIIFKKEIMLNPVNIDDVYKTIFGFVEPAAIIESFPAVLKLVNNQTPVKKRG